MGQATAFSYPEFLDLRASPAFASLAAWRMTPLSVSLGQEGERRNGMLVSADYFSALGIPIVQGRPFEVGDEADAVIISESMANAYWPGTSAVGARIRLGERQALSTVRPRQRPARREEAGERTLPAARAGIMRPPSG